MGKEILSILCPSCNAPAKYDIVHQNYHCGHCGNKIILGEVLEARKQYQDNQKRKLKEYTKDYSLMSATCKGCGASVVFEENEALSKCQFCGSSVVRKKYIYDERFPENIIPFGPSSTPACSMSIRRTTRRRITTTAPWWWPTPKT